MIRARTEQVVVTDKRYALVHETDIIKAFDRLWQVESFLCKEMRIP